MNQQGPPPKVEPLNIKKIILEIKDSEDLNTKDKKIKHLKKYRYIKTDYEFLYNLIINNDLNDDTIKEVKFPDPGPISKKSSFFFTFIKSTKSPSNTSSLIKFWPNLFFGEISFITLTE